LRPLVQGRGPRYLQIADQVARAVRQGTLKPGDQVPPQRWLASQLGVDLTTVTRAYAEVRSRGLIASFGGRGSFIAESYSAPRRATVDMAMNVPPLPAKRALADHINSGIENLLRNSGAESVSGYQNPELDSSALQAAKVWLGPMFKAMSGSRVLMCAGAQGAIYNLLLTHTRRGDPVLCDSLTYPGFLRAARALGLKIVGVPRDASGMLPDAIERCRRETGARVLYLNPTIQNPTTCTMPADRRREIAELIHRHDLTLIEDDPYWPLASDAPLPISSYMAGGHAFYLASLSKCLSPSLRLAYVLAPSGGATSMLAECFRASGMSCSPLLAHLAQTWILNGTAKDLLREIQIETRARQTLARSILPDGVDAHRTGIHLWLSLPRHWKPQAFGHALENRGIQIANTDVFDANEADPAGVRICIGGAQSHFELTAALQQIRALVLEGRPEGDSMVV